MLINHLGKSPSIDETSFIAPTAAICGDVKIGKNTMNEIMKYMTDNLKSHMEDKLL